MCSPKGYGFSAVLAINRLSTFWPFWSLNRAWVLIWVNFLEDASFSGHK